MKHYQKTTTENLIIAIYANDKKGLLGQVLMILNRRSHVIYNVNVSRTDIQDVVLITLEAAVPLTEQNYVISKIGNIVEVQKVISYQAKDVKLNKIAWFKIASAFMSSARFTSLQKYGAMITEVLDDAFIIQKVGTDMDLDELYRHLDSEHLISYCKSGLIVPQSLIALDVLYAD